MILNPYPKYKLTALNWLIEIPEHWKLIRNKYILIEINKHSTTGNEELLTVSQYTGVTPRKTKIDQTQKNLTNASSLIGYKLVENEDIVMNIMLAWNGSLGISNFKGIVSPAYCIYRPIKQVIPRYLHYLYRTPLFTGIFKTMSTGVVDSRLRLYPDAFLRLMTCLPPLTEQAQISKFLDYKCVQINQFIQKKKRLIALLKEQKQAIIHQAVTRGLNPNVSLKSSGVEWLGDIPEHWRTLKFKNFVKFFSGGTPPKSNESYWMGSIPWVSPKDMKQPKLSKTIDNISMQALHETASLLLPTNSLLMVVRSGILRRIIPIALNEVELAFNQDIKGIIVDHKVIYSKYLLLIIQGCNKLLLNKWKKIGATVESLEFDWMRNTYFSLPSLQEQIEIINNIELITKHLEDAIINIESQITLIQEYRTRLISDVVTGKIDIRNIKIEEINKEHNQDELIDIEDLDEESLDLAEVVNEDD